MKIVSGCIGVIDSNKRFAYYRIRNIEYVKPLSFEYDNNEGLTKTSETSLIGLTSGASHCIVATSEEVLKAIANDVDDTRK